MTDVAATKGAPARGFSLAELGDLLRRGDLALAIGVMTILVVLILPLPPMMLDLFLAVSIILSVLILMTSLFIHAPLEFSAFPTILLIATASSWHAATRAPRPPATSSRHSATS